MDLNTTTEIVSYLLSPDACRAARVSKKFRDAWNTTRIWTEKLLALSTCRIARSLTVERFRFYHPAVYFPQPVDRILTFLLPRDTARVALVDRTLRYLAYTHPRIKRMARAERQRYLAIEHPQVSLNDRMRHAAAAAERRVVQLQAPGNDAKIRFCFDMVFFGIGVVVVWKSGEAVYRAINDPRPIESDYQAFLALAAVSLDLVTKCAVGRVWREFTKLVVNGFFGWFATLGPVQIARPVAKLTTALQVGAEMAMKKVRVMARHYLN